MIKKNWAKTELESVNSCPYCSSTQSILVHKNVEDWSFNVAPGKWDYYKCINCDSLYLNPRPNRDSIGDAYEDYYTHDAKGNTSFINSLRTLIKNDWLSYLIQKPILPRLGIPSFLIKFAVLVLRKTKLPFWIDQLKINNTGKFLDMGSGSGNAVWLAEQLGWEAIGIDFDPLAVEASRMRDLTVLLGDDKILSNYHNYFDYVLCSHVLEHVHNPIEFIQAIGAAVKPNGILVLTLPNATSKIRDYFGDDWRGLEAPRHLSIPSQRYLITILTNQGFEVCVKSDDTTETVLESLRLKRRGMKPKLIDRLLAKFIFIKPDAKMHTNDFIKLVCTKSP